MKKYTLLLFVLIMVYSVISCEVLELKYYSNIKIVNDGNDTHQVGFGSSTSNITVEFDNLFSGDSSEFSVIEADDFRIFEKISGSWVDISSGLYADGFKFQKGKSYDLKIIAGSPDTYFIVEL